MFQSNTNDFKYVMVMWFKGWEKHDWRLTPHLLVAERELYLFKI